MTKLRRSGYVFMMWKTDHLPRHVQVYRDREFVVRWDLQQGRALEGSAPARVVKAIHDLEREGRL